MERKFVFLVQAMKKVPWTKSLFLWYFLFISIFLMSAVQNYAQSIPWEYYSKYEIIVPFSCCRLKTQLSIKEEARFREGSPYYNKIPVGLSAKISKNWEIGFYYSLKNKKNKNHWDSYHLLWPEVTYRIALRIISIDDRNRFEFHLTDKDQRYRNFLRIKFSTLKGKLIPWAGDEIRYFFKRAQFAMNELFAGLMYKPNHHFTINLYYDYRLIRNKTNFWEKANVFQSMIIYQF